MTNNQNDSIQHIDSKRQPAQQNQSAGQSQQNPPGQKAQANQQAQQNKPDSKTQGGQQAQQQQHSESAGSHDNKKASADKFSQEPNLKAEKGQTKGKGSSDSHRKTGG